MKRRRWRTMSTLLLHLLFLAGMPCLVAEKSEDTHEKKRPDDQSKPNILFIMADDLGYNDLDWKDPRLHTPVLRNLAFSGHSVLLSNSYVNQLCTPTRSAFMTGYYPFRVGSQNGVFLYMEPTGIPLVFPFLPQNLKTLGYKNYLIGKWHLGYCRKELLPTSRGFDYFYGYYGPQAGYFNHSADQYHRDLNRVVRGLDLFEEKSAGVSVPDFSKDGVYSSELFAQQAQKMLSLHDRTNPFFMFLSFQSVHPPLQVPKIYEKYCTSFAPMTNRRIYCAMLAAMDHAIQKVINHLKKLDLYNNTIIVFTSDNGGGAEFGASNYPLRGEKDTLWEGGTKTNTFVHAPRYIKEFDIRDELFHVVDWHATLIGASGHNITSYGDGINQWDYLVTGNSTRRRTQFIYNIDEKGSAIRYGDFKLIFGSPDRKKTLRNSPFKLYKVSDDPGETKDLAKSHPLIVDRLKAKLFSMAQYTRKSIRVPINLWGSPERLNGTYGSYWCL